MIGSAGVPCQSLASDSNFCTSTMVCSENRKSVCAGGCYLTGAAGIQRPHVEDVNPLHLAQNLDTLETSGLLEIGGDGARLGTLGEEVVLILDLCIDKLAFIPIRQKRRCRKSCVPRVMGWKHTRKRLRLGGDAVLVALLYSNKLALSP